jgi:hypothetical protein
MIRFSLSAGHLSLLAGLDLIHLSSRKKAAVQDQVGQVLRILQCIGLGQDAAVASAGQRKLTQIQRQTHVFHVLNHRLDGGEAEVPAALGDADGDFGLRSGSPTGSQPLIACAVVYPADYA